MNGTRALNLKKEVFISLYGKKMWDTSSREDIKAAYASSEFTAIYRRRKKNYNLGRRFA